MPTSRSNPYCSMDAGDNPTRVGTDPHANPWSIGNGGENQSLPCVIGTNMPTNTYPGNVEVLMGVKEA